MLSSYEIHLGVNLGVTQEKIERMIHLAVFLLNEYDRGNKEVDGSYVTMTSFYYGLDAFAVGCFNAGNTFFSKIGGREKAEKRTDSKFISSMGYAIKDLVANGACSHDLLENMKRHFSSNSLIGYYLMVYGISLRNSDLVEQGLGKVLAGHKVLTKPNGIFYATPDEYICFWAIGILKLAAYQGMELSLPESDLLPQSLLRMR